MTVATPWAMAALIQNHKQWSGGPHLATCGSHLRLLMLQHRRLFIQSCFGVILSTFTRTEMHTDNLKVKGRWRERKECITELTSSSAEKNLSPAF